MEQFVKTRGLDRPERRVALAAGSPGVAVSIDLEAYDKRRAAMLALAKVAAGAAPYSSWLPVSESIARSKSEKLELHLDALYGLLRDLLILREGGGKSATRISAASWKGWRTKWSSPGFAARWRRWMKSCACCGATFRNRSRSTP